MSSNSILHPTERFALESQKRTMHSDYIRNLNLRPCHQLNPSLVPISTSRSPYPLPLPILSTHQIETPEARFPLTSIIVISLTCHHSQSQKGRSMINIWSIDFYIIPIESILSCALSFLVRIPSSFQECFWISRSCNDLFLGS